MWCALTIPALAQGWPNSGGNAGRNGQNNAFGPLSARAVWSGSRPSVIAWQPVIDNGRVFVVRQSGLAPAGEPNGSPVVCHEVRSGAELWVHHVPYANGEWTTWLLGTSNGRVYASRSGNGASVRARIHALDQHTGALVWVSRATIDAGAYDGVVFAPNGDLVVASFRTIWRIRARDGSTVWSAPRNGSVSGNCGAALRAGTSGGAVYVADATTGGNVLKRFDLATGAFLYQSPVMPGYTIQNAPMVGPDGTVYLNRTQNSAPVDYFYAFADTGSAFVQRWRVPAQWSTAAEFAVGRDGSVYMQQPNGHLAALDPRTGAVRATTTAPLGAEKPRFVVDADGRLFVSNGGFAGGRLWSFNRDLSLRWSLPVPNINIGGPALARDGTLIAAGTGNTLLALRSPSPWADVGGRVNATRAAALSGRGTATSGNLVTLQLRSAAPGARSMLIIGAAPWQLPVLGGALVPFPQAVVGGLPINGKGDLDLRLRWPRLPVGARVWFQHWFADPTAPFGLAASNGLRATSR